MLWFNFCQWLFFFKPVDFFQTSSIFLNQFIYQLSEKGFIFWGVVKNRGMVFFGGLKTIKLIRKNYEKLSVPTFLPSSFPSLHPSPSYHLPSLHPPKTKDKEKGLKSLKTKPNITKNWYNRVKRNLLRNVMSLKLVMSFL